MPIYSGILVNSHAPLAPVNKTMHLMNPWSSHFDCLEKLYINPSTSFLIVHLLVGSLFPCITLSIFPELSFQPSINAYP